MSGVEELIETVAYLGSFLGSDPRGFWHYGEALRRGATDAELQAAIALRNKRGPLGLVEITYAHSDDVVTE